LTWVVLVPLVQLLHARMNPPTVRPAA
jgi:hypothetical protein